MALEPAGVSLQAEGFRDYLGKLDAIEKKQREVFDTEFKKTGKSFAQVTKAAKDYEKQLRETAKEQKRLEAAQKTAAATSRTAFISTTQAAIGLTKQVAEAAFELGKLGAQFQGQQTGLKNLASSFGQSGQDIQAAIVRAAKGTISDLQAIQAANQGLLLGVAKTPAEFEKLTSVALTLGRTLGLTATQSLDQFTTALGRQSLLILDNFGISAAAVNNEIERLAQVNFGKARSELTDAQRQAVFMEAALNKAGNAAERIGDEAGNAQAAFDRLTASSDNFKTALGLAISDLNQALGLTDALAGEINRATEGIKNLRGQRAGATLDEQIESTEIQIKSLTKTLEDTRKSLGGEAGFSLLEFFGLGGVGAALDEKAIETQTAALAELEQQLRTLNIKKSAEDARDFNVELAETSPIIDDNTDALKAYESALQQAQNLQLSFAREAEDAARKLARANEDVARKQGRSVAKLAERQEKDRAKLLKNQAKELDDFEKDRRKQITNAEDDIRKERQQANEQRKRDEKRLQRELQQERERFNLSLLQSERRFNLSERRLRAEGDILAIQQLREDRELERQEEKENFDLSQRQRKDDSKDSQKEQAKDLETRLKDLKSDLEDRRAELLRSFDEQLQRQREAQLEAQAEQQRGFAEAAEDRAIALAREEEDRRISQARQLEDLGISLASQKDVTQEGSLAIANELEKVFGQEGVADSIMTGFTTRTESEFKTLFEDLEKIVSDTKIEPQTAIPITNVGSGLGFGGRIGGLQEFGDGGVVGGSGPIGSPQLVVAHKGETAFSPTHQRSFTMAAPVIPSQTLNVAMSGGFNVTGAEAAGKATVQAAVEEMTENFTIAVRRLARRN